VGQGDPASARTWHQPLFAAGLDVPSGALLLIDIVGSEKGCAGGGGLSRRLRIKEVSVVTALVGRFMSGEHGLCAPAEWVGYGWRVCEDLPWIEHESLILAQNERWRHA
jgi:hypothetical protein